MRKVNPDAQWHTWPQEKPATDREIRNILVKGIGGLDDKLHYWLCMWVWTSDLKGLYYNGNEFNGIAPDREFEWLYVDEL